jgi:hypothetical protein
MASIDLLGSLGLKGPDHMRGKPASEPEPQNDGGIPERRDRRHQHGQPYGKELILERIGLWEEQYGAPPTKTDWDGPKLRVLRDRARARWEACSERVRRYEDGDWPSEVTVREHFGSVNAARAEAGYPPVPVGRPAKSSTPDVRPKMGEAALRGYFRAVAQARGANDTLALKSALYTLAMSAIREADRIDGGRA